MLGSCREPSATAPLVFTRKDVMSDQTPTQSEQKEALPLPEAVQHLLDECRMVLPGIQALFGFQLICVFNPGFQQRLTANEQVFHLAAIALVAVAIALVMTPAAYHRQTSPREVSEAFLAICTRLLLWSMLPLALGICVDFCLIARVILHQSALSVLLSLALLAIFFTLWFLLPRAQVLKKVMHGRR